MKYKQGDILTNNNGYRKVFGVCGEVYFMSYESEDTKGERLKQHFDGWTQYDLDKGGYKLYTPPEEMLEPIEEPLKVSKDIYDFIQDNVKPNNIHCKRPILQIWLNEHWSNMDNLMELIQSLKAYPNIEPIEELYYVKFIDYVGAYLNKSKVKDFYFIDDIVEQETSQTKFTRKEVEEISREEGKDYTPFMIKVEEN